MTAISAVRQDHEHVVLFSWNESAGTGYRANGSSRLIGIGATIAIYAVVLTGFFLTVQFMVSPAHSPASLTVLSLPEASPPDEEPQAKVAPEPVEQKPKPPEPPRAQPVERPIVPIPTTAVPLPAMTLEPADTRPVEPETAAPKTMPAPPAPRASSNAPDTWEGRVLAALNKHRRYPRVAQMRRQQGVPYIRFVMDREGRVMSSTLERSSGISDLDREAVALARRASPLPKPPESRPGSSLELVVPVEFFLR